MAARHSFSSMQGLTPMEAAVMEMHDGGASLAWIAAATGRSVKAIRKTIHTFGDFNEEGRARRSAETGSRNLLAAQLRAGQHELPPFLALTRATELSASGLVRL